jgi:UDP-glucuronate 4-epimerase
MNAPMAATILVTGAAGFIGSHTAAALADAGHEVVACDAFGGLGAVGRLQRDRVAHLLAPRGVPCHEVDLADGDALEALLAEHRFGVVVHLAAQAGVRLSAEAPERFVRSNLVAFANVLEACRHHGVSHLVYASSSSVYGAREEVPFREDDRADRPTSFYAATKRADELMAWSYAHLFGLRCTALRFFTVYGPWGRPDMAYFDFAQKIRRGEAIPVYGRGELRRDFTYVDDVVEGVRRVATLPCAAQASAVPHALFNVGHHEPVAVTEFVSLLERALGRTAIVRNVPQHRADVPVTCADATRLREWTGFAPATALADGLVRFARWLEAWDPLPRAGLEDQAGVPGA